MTVYVASHVSVFEGIRSSYLLGIAASPTGAQGLCAAHWARVYAQGAGGLRWGPPCVADASLTAPAEDEDFYAVSAWGVAP